MPSWRRGSFGTSSYSLTTSSSEPYYFGGGGSFSGSASSGSLTSGSQSTIAAAVYHYSITNASGQTGYAANGDLLAYTDSVMGAWTFSYDQLNRLGGAAVARAVGGTDSLFYCWSYDSFGNRLSQAGSNLQFQSGGSCQPQSSGTYTNVASSFNAQNQMTQTNARGVSVAPGYDAAGDVTADGANQYLYDAEGRICASFSGTTGIMTQDIYDAAGARVAKGTITSFTCDQTTNGFIQTNQYILGPAGEQLTEMTVASGAETWLHTNIYAGGSLIGTYENDGTGPHFRLTDWLGTMRAQTNYAGALEQTCQSLPFGETPTPCTRATEQLFTGKERDTETGNDYFGARYYNSNVGRWMSPDWSVEVEPVPYAKLDDPQSLNLYSYVYNNPVRGVDVEGHFGETDLDLALNQLGSMEQAATGWAKAIAKSEQQASSAVPLKDNKGTEVHGANGSVALVPSNFNIKAVIKAGTTDQVLRMSMPELGAAKTANDLAKFRRGGDWDLQRLGGKFDDRYTDSATILIGMYAAASGISRNEILSIQNEVAKGGKYAAGTIKDSTYTNLPERNVTNTDIGMSLVTSGAITGK